MTSSPGEHGKLEGSTVMLSMMLEEQKGEPEKEVFRIVKFQKMKPKALSLVEVVLNVQLYNLKYGRFFTATFDDPAKVVADHKVPMEIIIYTLEEILCGNADKAVMSYEKNDGKDDLLITIPVDSKIWNKIVTYKFCYKFQTTKMSLEESIDLKLRIFEQKLKDQGPGIEKMKMSVEECIDMKLRVFEQKLKDQGPGIEKMKMSVEKRIDMNLKVIEQKLKDQGLGIEKGDSRLEAIEEVSMELNDRMWCIPGKRVMEARFDISNNNCYTLSDHGTTVTHTGSNGWNTTALTTRMANTGYRASFRVMGLVYDSLSFGVVSPSFSKWRSSVGNNNHGWMVYFHFKEPGHSKHNGYFEGGGVRPLTGSLVTIEVYPAHGYIHYFVNGMPAGRHYQCSFPHGYLRFAVSTCNTKTKLKLLSVEQIWDAF